MQYKFLSVGLCLFSAASAGAAPVTWGSPFELVSTAQISLNYPVLYALNAGDTTSNANVLVGPTPTTPLVMTVGSKSVSFEGVEAKYGLDASFANASFQSFGDATDHLGGQNFNVTFTTTASRTTAIPQVSIDKLPTSLASEGRVYAVDTGDTTLNTILNSQVFIDGRTIGTSALNISLNNLTPGKEYQVQLVGPADSRAGANVPAVVTLNDGLGNSVAGLSGFADLDGDLTKHVTSVLGTFTADGSSQAINAVLADKRNGGISGLIVTVVPEPASLGLVVLGAGVLLRRRTNIKR